MLAPVVRLSLRNALHLGELIEIMKDVFVECARNELEAKNEAVSLSKLSVMTGVHRKDVTRIVRSDERVPREQNIISRVMVQWQHNPLYATKNRKPRVLTAEGRGSQFAELVKSVNGEDVSAYSILNEMQRLGVVERRGPRVELVWRDFVIGADIEAGISQLSTDVNTLSLAVEENLFGGEGVRNLHLKTEFDNIPEEYLSSIKSWILEEGSQFHRRVRTHLSQFDRDTNPDLAQSSGRGRVVVGAFSLSNLF
jgi:hypothetical protein